MQRRIESGLVILVGVGLIALTIMTQLFTRAPAFEELTDDFRPFMSDKAIAQMHTDIQGMEAMTAQMNDEVFPSIIAALKLDPTDFKVYAETSFPATMTGMEQLPAIADNFGGLAHTFAQQQENFKAADQIPMSGLPATTFPWGLLTVGIVVAIIGAVMLRTMQIGAMLSIALGFLMIASATLLSWPTKTAKADNLNTALRPVMTQEQADGAHGALMIVRNMGTEMRDEMLPALASQMGMTPSEMTTYLSENFPAVGGMLTSMDQMQGRFQDMADTMSANVGNYDTIKPLSMEPINWFFIVAGALIVMLGGLALFAPAPVHKHHPAAITH
jgi:hypothetical protein